MSGKNGKLLIRYSDNFFVSSDSIEFNKLWKASKKPRGIRESKESFSTGNTALSENSRANNRPKQINNKKRGGISGAYFCTEEFYREVFNYDQERSFNRKIKSGFKLNEDTEFNNQSNRCKALLKKFLALAIEDAVLPEKKGRKKIAIKWFLTNFDCEISFDWVCEQLEFGEGRKNKILNLIKSIYKGENNNEALQYLCKTRIKKDI